MLDENERKEKRRKKGLERSAIEGAAAETVQRFGSANKQHFVAYSGVDNEAGKQLTKGLKEISEYTVNPDYETQNIKQQAGFSAEIKANARKNADRIINKEKVRSSRTDDLGNVNDPLYDLVDIDENGDIIAGSGAQMKFVGASPDALLDKLNSKKYQKYLDADAFLDIADDDYDALMGVNGSKGIIDQRIENLKKQLANAEKNGNTDLANAKREQIEKYEKIKKNLRKSGVTREEAIEARLHPELSTAKDIIKISHRAGIEQAKYGAAIGGSISIIKNVVACAKGEKKPEEAAQNVILDTGKGAATSYATAFVGSTVKGMMQNAGSSYVRSLANTNLASGLVTTTISVGKTMKRYISGEIDGAECIEELGENGVGEIGACMFSSIGIAIVPSTAPAILGVIGGVAGATFGYAAAVAVYQELASSLKDEKIARENRLIIEAECAEAIKLIRQYRTEMTEMVEKYLSENIQTFNDGFSMMDKAILENDVDGFIKGNVEIQKILGKEVQFNSFDEFDALMESDAPLKL